MKRDVGHAYGATNAVLRDDNHPCLPGIPDDEVDILFSALADRGHAQRLGYVPAHKEEFWRAPPPEDARGATSTTKAPELKGRCGRAALAKEEKCNKHERCTWVFGSHACVSDCALKNEKEPERIMEASKLLEEENSRVAKAAKVALDVSLEPPCLCFLSHFGIGSHWHGARCEALQGCA